MSVYRQAVDPSKQNVSFEKGFFKTLSPFLGNQNPDIPLTSAVVYL
jgi:hypothetical protein